MGAEPGDEIPVPRGRGSGHPRAVLGRELRDVGADTAGAAVDQDMLPGSQLSVLVQRLPGGERAERNGGGRQMIHRGGLGGQVGGGGGDVLGGGAGAVETDQAVDLVAGLPAVGVRAGRGHDPRHVMAGDGGPALRPGQFVGRDRGGADLHEQFPRPRIGDGDALTGQAGRIGVRCAHGAHRTDGVVHGSCPSCAQGSFPCSAESCSAGSTPCSWHQARYTARWVSAIRLRYGQIGLRPRANQFRISWAKRPLAAPAITPAGSTACTPQVWFATCVIRRSTQVLASASAAAFPTPDSTCIQLTIASRASPIATLRSASKPNVIRPAGGASSAWMVPSGRWAEPGRGGSAGPGTRRRPASRR